MFLHLQFKKVFLACTKGKLNSGNYSENNAESAPNDSKANFIGSIYGQLVLRDMPEKVPPMFAAMSSDDVLSGQSGFEVIQAWQKRGIVELHLYGLGGHNFGMGHKPYTNALWPEEFMAWLKMIEILP